MWNDEKDNLFKILELLNKQKINFPTTCPSCLNNDCHVYIRDNGESVGSLWIWCSHCQEYIHATYMIPKWWKNCLSIESGKLQAEPSYLEDNKDVIDEWVNKLLKNSEEGKKKNSLFLTKEGFFTEMNLGFATDLSIKDYVFKNSDKSRAEKICNYLKNGTVIAACFGISKDIFDANKISGDQSLLTDGRYVWPNNLAYYVREYGVEIDNEFLEFMKANDWTNFFSIKNLQNTNVYIDGQKIF